jgi:pimeloyl-ACP methyl ester carboxylesterase
MNSFLKPVSRYSKCENREVHFMDWGPSNSPAVIAWHGLARTGRDMDELAEHLVGLGYRVICPDTIGRGLSQWSPDPVNEYQLSFYAKLAMSLVDQLGLKTFHWVGTSMGGAIGTVAAAGALRDRMLSLVLNDNGPSLAAAAIERIKAYAGNPPAFTCVTELESFLRTAYKPFGALSDAQWTRLAETSTRRLPDGRVTPHYDPAITGQLIHHPHDYDLWPIYDTLSLPVLCLRGAESDLLLRETTDAMQQRGPKAKVIEVAGCGHAPALNTISQLELISNFMAANP